jgi:hypothetical protein
MPRYSFTMMKHVFLVSSGPIVLQRVGFFFKNMFQKIMVEPF